MFHENIFPFIRNKSNFTNPFTFVFEVDANSPNDSMVDTFVTPIRILEVPINSHGPHDSSSDTPALPSPSLDADRPNSMSIESNLIPDTTMSPTTSQLLLLQLHLLPPLPITALPHTKKSTKAHKALAYLQDYACNSTAASHSLDSPYDIADSLTYSHLNPPY